MSGNIDNWTEGALTAMINMDPHWMKMIDEDGKDGISETEMENFIKNKRDQYVDLVKAICFPGSEGVEYTDLDGSAEIISDFLVNGVGKQRYDIGYGSQQTEIETTDDNLLPKWRFATTDTYFAEFTGFDTDRDPNSATKQTYSFGGFGDKFSAREMNDLYKGISGQQTFNWEDENGNSLTYTAVHDGDEFKGYSLDGGNTVNFPNTADGWKNFQKTIGGGDENAFDAHQPLSSIAAWDFDPDDIQTVIHDPDAVFHKGGKIDEDLLKIFESDYTAQTTTSYTYTVSETAKKKNRNWKPDRT